MMEDFDDMPKMAGWHESKLTVPAGATMSFAAVKPNHSFTFHQMDAHGWANGPRVGSLDFNGPEMKFEGQADESAKVFFDYLAKYFHERLVSERAKELDACCNLLEGMHAATDGNHNYYLHAANELRKLRKNK